MLLLLPNDTMGDIFKFLSLDQKRSVGLTCSKLWHMYQEILSKHIELKYFQEQLVLISHFETGLISIDNDGCDFGGPEIYHVSMVQDNIQLTKEEAFEEYKASLDKIVVETIKNRDLYNQLEIPAMIKYLINIWIKCPSKLLRLVPYDILKIYLDDVEKFNLEFVMLFDLYGSSESHRYISNIENMWNCRDKIVKYQIYSLIFSVKEEFKLLLGRYPDAYAKIPKINGTRYFVIDPEYKIHKPYIGGDLEYRQIKKNEIQYLGYYYGNSMDVLNNYLGWILGKFE